MKLILRVSARVRGWRLAYVILDQGVSAGTNLVGTVVVASIASISEFADAAAAFLVYSLMLGVWKGLFGEVLVYRLSASIQESGTDLSSLDPRSIRDSAIRTSVWLNAFIGACLVITAWLLENPYLAVLGFLAVPLCAVEIARHFYFGLRKPWFALLVDGIWLFLTAFLAILSVFLGWSNPLACFLFWAGPGAFVGVACWAYFFIDRVRVSGAKLRSADYLRRNGRMGATYCSEYMIGSGLGQLVIILCALLVGEYVMSAIRGSQTLLGPLGVILSGSIIILTLAGRRQLQNGRPAIEVAYKNAFLSLIFVAFCAAYLVIVLVFGDRLGPLLLGSSWTIAREAIVPLTIGAAFLGLSGGAAGALRAYGAAGVALRARIFCVMPVVGFGVLGASSMTVSGVAWGIAAGNMSTAIFYWIAAALAARSYSDDASGVT